jgi:L-lactate dehydrogenase complex protein LldG
VSARDDILGNIRRSLGRGVLTDAAAAIPERRVAGHRPNLVPGRVLGLDREALLDAFEGEVTAIKATVARLPGLADVPDALAGYLASHNLPSEITTSPDPVLGAVPWDRRPTLRRRTGVPGNADMVGVSVAAAAIAETGTLMLESGPDNPSTLNFLPDTHVVVLPTSRVVGPMEDALTALRVRYGEGQMPRTVNFITGPSRTADIEQKIEMGAHGPRRLHILVIEDAAKGS